ncbi:MAG: hypothetical protein ABR584_12445 [Candidatus Baltobacteraceae bacterium]
MPLTLFGSRLRTKVLVVVGALEESYPAEIARITGASLLPVQRVIRALEESGVVVTRARGRTRLVTLNRRFFAHNELYALLLRCSERPEFANMIAVRRRPRATAKPLPS